MRYDKINSQAKINLSLHVIKKLKNNYHNIESLVTFLKLSDDILVRKSSIQSHKVLFYGKFAKGINSQNTITKLLSILDKKNLLSNQKFEIKVKKYSSAIGDGWRIYERSQYIEVLYKKKKLLIFPMQKLQK